MEIELIEKTIDFVKKSLEHGERGHDWWHIQRVYTNAKSIMENESADRMIVFLASLLHDIADAKFHDGDETIGPRIAQEFLIKNNVPKSLI